MIHIINYLNLNKDKQLTIKVWFWTALFRFILLCIPTQFTHKYYGFSGEESPEVESLENYIKAKKIAYHVNRIADRTPWESKCLVRALTAQRLFTKKQISSTLYLGVQKIDDKMVAHAWIRTGSYYATGGNGEGYTMVAKFRK
jgi:hypothetical protein